MSGHERRTGIGAIDRRPAILRMHQPPAMAGARWGFLLAAAIGIGLLASGWQLARGVWILPHLVWNASASAPIGLWYVDPNVTIGRGDMAVARTPESVRQMAARRHYLPVNVPLLKQIAATNGDEVCAVGTEIFVNGVGIATRQRADHQGRLLPWWTGCTRLRARRVLLMTKADDSFDARYFGPTARSAVLGKASPLWLP